MKLSILKNEFDEHHKHWEEACLKFNYDYEIIDITKNSWFEKVLNSKSDGFLICPSSRQEYYKKLYDERLYIIDKVMKRFCYPSYDEVVIHENKKFFSYWLKAQNIPSPKTSVFYDKREAFAFINLENFPIVAKINIGAGGKGVKIFREKLAIKSYVDDAFSKGIKQEWGPNFKMGNWRNRIKKIINNPSRVKKRIEVYKKVYNEIQKNFVIFQEYIPHKYEWRIVKIGDSYFGHQKILDGEKASGTKGIEYAIPPDKYLDFVKDICKRFNFNSMAIDMFEDGKGGLLVNEMQTVFGHIQEYICEKDGKAGRFLFKDGKWLFEEGIFNTNLSYDLRLKNVVSLLDNNIK